MNEVRPTDEALPRVDFREGARGIVTWVETGDGAPLEASLEILRPARELADTLGTSVTSVLIGKDVAGMAPRVFAYGADRVVVVEDDRLAQYTVLPFTRVFSEWFAAERPEIALFPATTSGRELAPRIGSRVRAGVTADCTELVVGDFLWKRRKKIMYPCLQAIRPTYGESKLATIVGFWCPQMATARPGTFAPLTPDPRRVGEIVRFVPRFQPEDFAVEVLESRRAESGRNAFDDADIIVSGGRPCGELDGFQLVHQLVRALQEKGWRAEWGASRQAVDRGFAPHDRQIGQTGKTVRPKVYVAVAISGAVQHLAGMKDSKTIIAVNKSPSAPILRNADFGLVGDYRHVLPLLIERVRGGFTFGLVAEPRKAEVALLTR